MAADTDAPLDVYSAGDSDFSVGGGAGGSAGVDSVEGGGAGVSAGVDSVEGGGAGVSAGSDSVLAGFVVVADDDLGVGGVTLGEHPHDAHTRTTPTTAAE